MDVLHQNISFIQFLKSNVWCDKPNTEFKKKKLKILNRCSDHHFDITLVFHFRSHRSRCFFFYIRITPDRSDDSVFFFVMEDLTLDLFYRYTDISYHIHFDRFSHNRSNIKFTRSNLPEMVCTHLNKIHISLLYVDIFRYFTSRSLSLVFSCCSSNHRM